MEEEVKLESREQKGFWTERSKWCKQQINAESTEQKKKRSLDQFK